MAFQSTPALLSAEVLLGTEMKDEVRLKYCIGGRGLQNLPMNNGAPSFVNKMLDGSTYPG